MSETDDFEETLETAFVESDASGSEATRAAEMAATYREEYDEDLSAETVREAVADAPYGAFTRRFNHAIGDLAADNEDCTDSRAFRFESFGDLSADPKQGA